MTDADRSGVELGDCIELMRGLEPASVDAIVTDPPYGLEFMGKEWDRNFGHEAWAREALRVLKPGAHLLAFGGTRTYHRLACAIEDAGFEIRDTIAWMYGSGFPKSHNLGTGWGTALKPAHEPIVVARKPLVGTVAANVSQFGTGALNVDATRIGSDTADTAAMRRCLSPKGILGGTADGWDRPWKNDADAIDARRERAEIALGKAAELGRWPANVVLDEEAAALLDEQSGTLQPPKPYERGPTRVSDERIYGGGKGIPLWSAEGNYGDRGDASRFFYCAKASRSERGEGNVHPTVKPIALMRWLVRLVTPPDGLVLDPFAGSGSTGCAAVLEGFRFLGFERDEEYAAIARARIEHAALHQLSLFAA